MKSRALIILAVLLCSLVSVLPSFTSYMKHKPFIEKIGYVPEPGVLKAFTADQEHFVAAFLIGKVISYYGGLVDKAQQRILVRPEYGGMEKLVETAVKLDPYNMDAYYFAQAILALGAGRIREVNSILEYGMHYRDWDFYLPSFAAFNYAYYLKDYGNAAKYYKRVGDLTGDILSIRLAGRYMYEAGRTDMAISYLTMMVKGATNEAIKQSLLARLHALQGIRVIEQAKSRFLARFGRLPRSVDELLERKYLSQLPVDPYGGMFYLDVQGKVRTTSKLAYGVVKPRR